MISPTGLHKPWWRRARVLVPLTLLLLLLAGVRGVAGYFLPTAETATLRKSAVKCLGGEWHKRFGVHVGWFTTAALRLGTSAFHLPKEPRAVLEAIHAGDVGIYRLDHSPDPRDVANLFAEADGDMQRRGWERTVSVMSRDHLVAIYTPSHRGMSLHRTGVAVMVLKDQDFVLVSARGNLEPLIDLAAEKKGMTHRTHDGLGEELLEMLGKL